MGTISKFSVFGEEMLEPNFFANGRLTPFERVGSSSVAHTCTSWTATSKQTMVDWIEVAGNVLLFALVFGMSATVDIKCLKQQLHNRNAILIGIFLQFVILPLIGFLVVKILDLDSALGITLLVVTSSPGGSYSNW